MQCNLIKGFSPFPSSSLPTSTLQNNSSAQKASSESTNIWDSLKDWASSLSLGDVVNIGTGLLGGGLLSKGMSTAGKIFKSIF